MSITKGQPQNMLFVCVTVGIVLLASKYRDNVFRGVKQICSSITHRSRDDKKKNNRHKDVIFDKIILADSLEKCDFAIQNIRGNLTDSVLGFDCEWVNGGSVSLIQLATRNGVCALFRLGKIGCVPPKLKELLANRRLLKVGVASYEDGRKISSDFGFQVSGTLDLRALAQRLKLEHPKSLGAFCMHYLGIKMDKLMEVQSCDWDADSLTQEQINYAAFDAHASVLIYHQILRAAQQKRSLLDTVVIYIKNVWNEDEEEKYHALPRGVIDNRFEYPKDSTILSEHSAQKVFQQLSQPTSAVVTRTTSTSSLSKQLPTRNKPLYHNCYLQAPDGETLCTCDRKKAEWYVSKNLGSVVNEDPFTVKLTFEPSGRALGAVGQYYTQVKVNQCVVCGASEEFNRKNVVPREYRKYFPLVMKAHQSHDVLLLCPACHRKSSEHDADFRKELAIMCNAPVSPKPPNFSEPKRKWNKYQTAMKTMLKDNTMFQQKGRNVLETYIKSYTKDYDIAPHNLNALQERFDIINTNSNNSNNNNSNKFHSHGYKVVEYFRQKEGGLVELEKLWREHFLKMMKPQYLPKLWSVSHNQDRLEIRKEQNRIEPEDAKVAGLTGAA